MPEKTIFQRPALMGIIVLICLIMTIYLQSQGQETVYTHLFYIPIILSCIWWQKKGILTALFLGGVVLTSHIIFQPQAPLDDDILRSLIFLIIAVLVAELSSREKIQAKLLDAKFEAKK